MKWRQTNAWGPSSRGGGEIWLGVVISAIRHDSQAIDSAWKAFYLLITNFTVTMIRPKDPRTPQVKVACHGSRKIQLLEIKLGAYIKVSPYSPINIFLKTPHSAFFKSNTKHINVTWQTSVCGKLPNELKTFDLFSVERIQSMFCFLK